MGEVRKLHAIEGEGHTVEEVETAALVELYEVAKRHRGDLRAARSVLRSFWDVIERETEYMLERRDALPEAVR